ncbi:MAG TPA: amidohydrolase [Bacteroides sp.]|nr:amidohydrolase [Bacteroides sp.]
MIIDSHHHFWEFNKEDYRWIDDSMSILRRDFLPPHLEDQLQEADVSGTVVVQARQNLDETRWLLELAGEYDFIRGVVGWVDLRSEEIENQINELADNPKLVGVRHVVQDEPDDDFMLRADFIRGIEKLKSYNLAYDLLLFPKHLSRAAELVSMFPEQKFVLDHISKPLIKSGILDPWRADLEHLAARPNIWCKISGLVTEADTENWKYENFIPYLDVVVDAFGTNRLMIGSDWPVCLLAGEYSEILDIPQRYFKKFSAIERVKIMSSNCIDFYDLPIQ